MSDKIAELAREAGIPYDPWPDSAYNKNICRFSALVEDDFKNRLAQAIEQMPFGDTATSFATFVRNFK